MQTQPIPTNEVPAVFSALQQWINQRSGIDFRNYGDVPAFRSEQRTISQQKRQAQAALDEAMHLPLDGHVLADCFNSAFSGRLQWDGKKLDYTTGQYWCTEYRAAAAVVLERYCHAVRPKFLPNPGQQFQTMSDIKAAMERAGSHWFERSTMRFFRTRIVPKVYNGVGGIFFVSSEQFDDNTPRRYTVRQFIPESADIKTIGDFNRMDRSDAMSYARELSKTPKAA